MNQEKYIGMDVHQATISVAGMDGNGKLIMECVLETKAAIIVEFVQYPKSVAGRLNERFQKCSTVGVAEQLRQSTEQAMPESQVWATRICSTCDSTPGRTRTVDMQPVAGASQRCPPAFSNDSCSPLRRMTCN